MSSHITVEKGPFAETLAIVGRAVPSNAQLPILANFLITGENGQLRLAATNLTLGISAWMEAQMDAPLALTLPAKMLTDIVNSLSSSNLQLSVNGKPEATIQSRSFKGVVRGIEATEFPAFPEYDVSAGISIEAGLLRKMIQATSFAASSDDARPVLSGVQVMLDGTSLTMAASDGFRLALCNETLPAAVAAQGWVVPASSLKEAARIMSATRANRVTLFAPPSGAQVVLRTEQVQLVSQLIDGRYPDYRGIIPNSHRTRTVVATAELHKACKQASIFARDGGNLVKLRLTPGEEQTGKVTVLVDTGETGESETELPASVTGPELTIAFNVHFLLEGLEAIQTSEVVIETNTHNTPAVFRPADGKEALYVLMPMHIDGR